MTFDLSDDLFSSDPITNSRTSVALGNFDGLTIAHQALLAKAKEDAAVLSQTSGVAVVPAVFTFRSLKQGACEIFPFDEKLRLIENYGANVVAYADFASVKDMSPEEFVQGILLGCMRAASVVCGYNFRFGKNASGDVDVLRKLLDIYSGGKVSLHVIDQMKLGDMPISSSEVRNALLRGDIGRASLLLGRDYEIVGFVMGGRAVGRTMGVPTINIPISERMLSPKHGVYFSRLKFAGKCIPAIVNIGVRPTFDELCGQSAPLCEIHLLTENIDHLPSVGDRVRVVPLRYVREEVKFDDTDSLYRQITADIDAAKKYFELI